MIQSMTGFGKSVTTHSHKKITIQLKSLNSKKFDLYTRIPSLYREKELQLHKQISKKLSRGKVDFTLSVENAAGDTTTQINHAVVKNYMAELKTLANLKGEEADVQLLKTALSLPDAISTAKEEIEDAEFATITQCLEAALQKLIQYRIDEGKALEKDFKLRIENLETLLKQVETIDPERIQNTRERLASAVAELKENIDKNRFEQELIYYIEKYDITEEKTRLRNHLAYFLETLNAAQSNGRKLGFISQEMGREINTMGSKSNYAPMQKLVVQMKDELEKIKEQLLNVL